MLIARLIADPDGLETRVNQAIGFLEGQGMQVALSRLLESGDNVVQLSLPKGDRAEIRKIVEAQIAPTAALLANSDIEVPKLFVSDMDSTIIGQECIDELADFAGLKDRVAAITERAMRGELEFESALRERVSLLSGLDENAITQCLTERIRPTKGARCLVQTLKAKGCRTVLVTGGFHHFADAIAEEIGFDRVVGNRLAVADGKLTGDLAGPISDSGTKLAVLQEEAARIGRCAILAAGDGANDIPMLEAATYGMAFKAKPAARSAASGWIDDGDLTAILDLLQIPRHDWVQ